MNVLKQLAVMSGLGSQILVAVDRESDPLRNICHFLRFETIRFNKDDSFDEIKFALPCVDNDPRIALMPEVFNGQPAGRVGFIPSGVMVTAEYSTGRVCMTPGSYKGERCFMIELERFDSIRKTVMGCSVGGMKALHECSKHMMEQLP